MLLSILLMVFLTATFLFMSIFMMVEGRESPVDRLEYFVGDETPEILMDKEKKERKSWIKYIGRRLEKIKLLNRLTKGASAVLIQADIPLTGEEFTVIRLSITGILTYFMLMITKDLMVGLVVFIIIWMLPMFYVKRVKEKRIKKFNEQLSDTLVLFSNSLKAGYSYLQAVSSVAKEMPEPMSKEFGRVLKEMSFGMDSTKTLLNLLTRVDSEDLKLMVTAIVIQKETGGNLAEILDNIAGTIRERITLQNEIKTLTAQGKFSGIIVGCIPFVLMLFMYMVNKPYIMILFTNKVGILMLVAGGINLIIGAVIINKIIKIEV